AATDEPNTEAIIQFLKTEGAEKIGEVSYRPSMDALACSWSRYHNGGVRVVRQQSVKKIIDVGSRAFNLRVADPYLPYHKQGLGFTWSFFTPKDKQDLHVHGLPSVEIYGVMEGCLQLWSKPMTDRGRACLEMHDAPSRRLGRSRTPQLPLCRMAHPGRARYRHQSRRYRRTCRCWTSWYLRENGLLPQTYRAKMQQLWPLRHPAKTAGTHG
ncbi:MAG: hypothetical protein KAG66_13060, partial [Methylococcales bacterium]|nr:hypothetical protein [Methylococcales bacterium]